MSSATTVLAREPSVPSAAGPLGLIRRHPITTFLCLIVALSFINMWIEVFPAPAADRAIAQWSFNALLVLLALVLVAVFGAARLSRKAASALPVTAPSAAA